MSHACVCIGQKCHICVVFTQFFIFQTFLFIWKNTAPQWLIHFPWNNVLTSINDDWYDFSRNRFIRNSCDVYKLNQIMWNESMISENWSPIGHLWIWILLFFISKNCKFIENRSDKNKFVPYAVEARRR